MIQLHEQMIGRVYKEVRMSFIVKAFCFVLFTGLSYIGYTWALFLAGFYLAGLISSGKRLRNAGKFDDNFVRSKVLGQKGGKDV